jgi:UDP-galactopyranose mutase
LISSSFDLVVVGCGFFGATIAERAAVTLGKRVLIIERRPHIAGNCYSYLDEASGIEVHRYGTHIFHTSSESIWRYINRFTEFNSYRHKVLTTFKDRVYQLPINLNTINQYYHLNLKPQEVDAFLRKEIEKEDLGVPGNLEEMAISLIGRPLYEAFIRGYTIKQWETDPLLLPASIIKRLPVRSNYNGDYFDDTYQGIPKDGYTSVFERMLDHPNIEVMLETDYFEIRDQISRTLPLVYSGPIDRYFGYRHGKLGWRTLDFETEVHDVKDYQGTSVMNYADGSVKFTRIHEFKHLHPERTAIPKTIITKEFSRFADKPGDEPYYPIATEENRIRFKRYERDCKGEKGVIFGGRLGMYQYLDMHQVIGSALASFEKLVKPALL